MKTFEKQLSGGYPNSLGNTEAVVEQVLENPSQFQALFDTYQSADEVVRLRVSSAMKRIAKANKNLILPYMDRFLTEVSQIDQASTQWTLADLFSILQKELTAEQREAAELHMKHNLEHHNDWIVLNRSMMTLADWAQYNTALKNWLLPQLKRLQGDSRKSVAGKATKLYDSLNAK